MAEFDFCVTVPLGFSHYGEETAYGDGTVELTLDEVDALIALMREKESEDVEDLNLQQTLPEVYEKLDRAYRDAAWLAVADHWYTTGYYDNVYEYDIEQLMDYCAEHHGFEAECDEDDLFDEWLDDFIGTMNPKERMAFLQEHLNAEVDLSDMDLDYELEIPDGILGLMLLKS